MLSNPVKSPAMSAFPDMSKLVASISPEALNITLSAFPTLKIIWSFVLNLIWSVESLPITKDVFNMLVGEKVPAVRVPSISTSPEK